MKGLKILWETLNTLKGTMVNAMVAFAYIECFW